MRIPCLFLLARHAAAVSASSVTIASIKSGSKVVDIVDLPRMLTSRGFPVDKRIAGFLETAEVETLHDLGTQIVKTSTSTVGSDELCDFVINASKRLYLQSDCTKDDAGEIFGEYDPILHVNDPDARYQKHLQWLEMGEVWRISSPYVERTVKVAVLDSGIDWSDGDFAPLKKSVKKRSGGYIDGGWNFCTNSSNLTHGLSHGTNVCRILAAKDNNSYGMVGVAPNITFIPLQVADDDGKLYLSGFLAALDMAIDLEVDVISASLGFDIRRPLGEQHLLWNALRTVQQHGILLVSAAGNDGMRASNTYPCWFGGPLGICVAFLTDYKFHNILSPFTNWGERVDMATYGTNIFSGRGTAGKLTYVTGSSAAAPIVAGVAAILLSMGIKQNKVKTLMLANAKPVFCERPDTDPQTIRGGALDAMNTIKHAIKMLELGNISHLGLEQ